MDESQPKFDLSKLATAKGAESFRPASTVTRKRRLDLRTWTPLLLVVAGTAALTAVYLVPLLEPVHEAALQPVVVEQDAEQRRSTTALLASGWVEPNPYPMRVNPQVSGRVEHLNDLVEGDRLVAGETVVAQLDTTLIEREIAVVEARIAAKRQQFVEKQTQIERLRTLEARNFDARLRLARLERELAGLTRAEKEAQAELTSAQAKREQNAELRMDHAHHDVMHAQVAEELRRHEQKYEMIEARLPYLKAQAEALEDNVEANAVTELEALEARTAYEEALKRRDGYEVRIERLREKFEATHRTCEIARELVAEPEALDAAVREARAKLDGISPQIEALQKEIRVAREEAEDPLLFRTDIEVLTTQARGIELEIEETKAELALLEERKRLHTVLSPVDGEVLEVVAQPGSTFGTMEGIGALVTAYDPQKIQVRVYLPFGDVPAVEPGQRVEITSDAVPGHTYEGVVARFVRKANLARNALEVKVEVQDPDGRLKPEMLTRCRFLPIERERADDEPADVLRFYVPRTALADTPEGEAVYVYDPRGHVQGEGLARRVAVTAHEGAVAPEGHVEVEGPLQRGQRVIASPPSGLGHGSRVRPQ